MRYLATGFVILAISLVLIASCGCTQNATPSPTSNAASNQTSSGNTTTGSSSGVASLTLTSPANNSQVGYTANVVGTAHPQSGQSVWVLVYVQTLGNYYPQSRVTVSSNGSWNSTAYFGTSTAGIGQRFNVIAALADPTANSTMSKYLTDSRANSSYPGIPLPSGIVAQQQVTVTRTT